MEKKLEAVLLFVLILGLFLNECIVGYSASGKMRIYVEPENSVAVAYATFKVNVSIADVPDPGVFSYEFKLYYNNTLLNATKAEIPPDHWLKPSLKPTYIFIVDPGTINQSQGYVSFAVTLLAPEPGKTGNGTLATVTFRAQETGGSNLTILSPILVPPACGPWMPEEYDVFGGFVEVTLPDLNNDRKVDVSDLAIIAKAFGSYPNHKRWNPICDVNRDSEINIIDMVVTAKSFGKTATLISP